MLGEKIVTSTGLWYAEREGNTWNLFGKQEDFTFGLVQNGLLIEDLLPMIEESAEWQLCGIIFQIVKSDEQ